MNRFKKPKAPQGQRIPVNADRGKWGVWVGPGLWVTANQPAAPNRFHQFVQRLLLGWRWEVKQ